jgi:hypothetical protein
MANPVKSSLRIAGKAGLIMAAPYIAVPAMVAHHGIKKVSSAKRDIRAGRANRNDQYLEAGRAMRTARAPGGAGPP